MDGNFLEEGLANVIISYNVAQSIVESTSWF